MRRTAILTIWVESPLGKRATRCMRLVMAEAAWRMPSELSLNLMYAAISWKSLTMAAAYVAPVPTHQGKPLSRPA